MNVCIVALQPYSIWFVYPGSSPSMDFEHDKISPLADTSFPFMAAGAPGAGALPNRLAFPAAVAVGRDWR